LAVNFADLDPKYTRPNFGKLNLDDYDNQISYLDKKINNMKQLNYGNDLVHTKNML